MCQFNSVSDVFSLIEDSVNHFAEVANSNPNYVIFKTKNKLRENYVPDLVNEINKTPNITALSLVTPEGRKSPFYISAEKRTNDLGDIVLKMNNVVGCRIVCTMAKVQYSSVNSIHSGFGNIRYDEIENLYNHEKDDRCKRYILSFGQSGTQENKIGQWMLIDVDNLYEKYSTGNMRGAGRQYGDDQYKAAWEDGTDTICIKNMPDEPYLTAKFNKHN